MAGTSLTPDEARELALVLTGWGLIVKSVDLETGTLVVSVPPAYLGTG
jgi:hypothetical protein